MKFNNITFPHPVFGLGDAISGSIELGDYEINSLQNVYDVKIICKHDNNDLKNLINEDKAEFLCEITCSNTLYRKLFLFNNGKMNFEIPKKVVKGRVDFTCLLVAKEKIPKYSNTEAHPDYDGYTFDLDQGDVLAYFGGIWFNADIKYEKLKAVSSFMEIVSSEDFKYTNVDLKNQKILIKLPLETYKLFQSDFISQEVKFAPIFHSSIVLNALLTALYNLEEHKDYMWAKAIDYRLKNEKQFDDVNIDEKENIPEIAQMLLGNPFKRLLESLNVIVESENEE